MIKIIKPSEPILTQNITMLIYGNPGLGKSTLGFTARKALVLDFDGGLAHIKNRNGAVIVQLSCWQDAVDIVTPGKIQGFDLNDFDTIVIDTIGKAIEFLSADLLTKTPSFSRGGAPTIQAWGVIKNKFSTWKSIMEAAKKDIIFLAHAVDEKDGDIILNKFDVDGGAKKILNRDIYNIGYLSLENGKRVIEFNVSSKNVSKNRAEIERQIFDKDNKTLLADIIEVAKNNMNSKSAEQIKAEQEFQEVLDDIHRLDTIESLNVMVQILAEGDPLHKQALLKHGVSMGFEFDKANKCFKIKAPINNDFDNLPNNEGVA